MSAERLVPNPFTEITIEKVKRRQVRAEMLVTVRGRGVRSLVVDRKKDPEFFEVIRSIFNSRGKKLKLSLSEQHLRRLKHVGYLLDPESVPIAIPFECSLADLSLDLVPRWFHAELEAHAAARDLVVHPTFRCDENHTAIPKGFAPASALAWLEDPGTGVRYPYWVPSDWVEIIRSLTPGSPPKALPEAVRTKLAWAGILVSPTELEPHRWDTVTQAAHHELSRNKYARVRNVLWPFHIAALRKYVREVAAEGFLKVGDPLVKRRLARHNEPIISFFHQAFLPLVEKVVRSKLKASYNYIGVYLPGALLKKHTDRRNSDYAVNIHLDFEPEPSGESPWPLYLESLAGESIPVNFKIGDMLIYRGMQIPHFRKKFTEGTRSTSFFLFYVSENVRGPLD